MSSRLIPPKAGAILTTVRMISSVSWVSRQIGTAFTPAELFEKNGFSFHDRHGGEGADVSESEKQRSPSETTATVFALIVYL